MEWSELHFPVCKELLAPLAASAFLKSWAAKVIFPSWRICWRSGIKHCRPTAHYGGQSPCKCCSRHGPSVWRTSQIDGADPPSRMGWLWRYHFWSYQWGSTPVEATCWPLRQLLGRLWKLLQQRLLLLSLLSFACHGKSCRTRLELSVLQQSHPQQLRKYTSSPRPSSCLSHDTDTEKCGRLLWASICRSSFRL